MTRKSRESSPKTFRHFFFRGLGILLPSVLTIWLIVAAYNFVDGKIAEPINSGVKLLIINFSDYPWVANDEIESNLPLKARDQFNLAQSDENGMDMGNLSEIELKTFRKMARTQKLNEWWAAKPYMSLIGLVIAIFLIYFAGVLLGSYIGRSIYHKGEDLLKRLPVFKQVYPHVKQVTDFFVGDKNKKIQFNKVVAVEYPRKGLWSLGLVTGDTLQTIQTQAGCECVTVFVPSSPTPFTGYVITVPKEDTIELDITIDDALRFSVSGGVIVPESQMIRHDNPEKQSKNKK